MLFTPPKKHYLSFLVTKPTLRIGKLGGKNSFSHFFETAIPEGLIANGEVKNIDTFAQFLLSVKKQAKITEKYVSICLPETKATTHTLVLPPIEEKEIEQAILREAPTFLPFMVSEEYIDWKIVEKTPENTRVLVSAVPKHVVEGFATAFIKAGFSPVAFETVSLSLFRLVPPTDRLLSMAAEINETKTILILIVNGSVEVCSVISDNTNLLDKLHRIIQFFVEQKTEGKTPQTLYLSGKLAAALAPQIQQALSIKVQFLKANILSYPEQKQIEYALLYSLANKTVSKPLDSKTINIMPDDLLFKYEEIQRKQFERMLKIIFVVALLVFLGVSYNSYQSIANAKNALKRRAVPSASPVASQGELSFSPSKVKLLGTLASQNDQVVAVIDELYKTVSTGVSVISISYEKVNNEIIVIGQAQTRDALLVYRDILEKTNLFAKVTVPLSSLENDANFEYRLILELKATAKTAAPTISKAAGEK